nr:enoyl-CoA hydratase-related protein [Rhodococcus sp. (in: high G+C Gram-positive bacteria)]
MTEQILLTDRNGAVASIGINRPDSRNALNGDLLDAMAAELESLRDDPNVLAVVIYGVGGVFCAGADITAFDEIRAKPLIHNDAFWSILRGFHKPVIAAVEKYAFGGGCELALACDVVIAGRGARFAVPEVKLGAIPGAGGTQRLIRSVGKSKAMAMLLSGDALTAENACNAGLIAEVVDDGAALSYATELGQRIARNSPLAVALVKDAALASFETSLTHGLEHEKRNFFVAVHSDDSHEGQAAFLEKRSPQFTGK